MLLFLLKLIFSADYHTIIFDIVSSLSIYLFNIMLLKSRQRPQMDGNCICFFSFILLSHRLRMEILLTIQKPFLHINLFYIRLMFVFMEYKRVAYLKVRHETENQSEDV